MRRCGFFFDVFGLELPEYLSCKLFLDSPNPDECVGGKEMKELKTRKPVCSEFSCDKKRCIPHRYVCDGVVDCFDQTDELSCYPCNASSIHCGDKKCMSDRHICDGTITCPYAQDERNCIRLSSTNGDLGKGTLEVYKASKKRWEPACIRNWVPEESPTKVCSLLGYSSVNSSRVLRRGTNITLLSNQDPTAFMRMSQRKSSNLLKDYSNCNDEKTQIVAELTCTNFECGKVRTKKRRLPKKRIIGGSESTPGGTSHSKSFKRNSG
jgi:atrial natriuretic peptide-converting enzyme